MTKSELIRTLIGLMLIDALFTFGFRYWADHDPRVASSFVYWFIIPMVSVLVIGMAALQLYWYSVRCSDIDVWMPSAGPSIELLTAFHMRSIVWEEFLTLYQVDQQNQRACCVVTYAGG